MSTSSYFYSSLKKLGFIFLTHMARLLDKRSTLLLLLLLMIVLIIIACCYVVLVFCVVLAACFCGCLFLFCFDGDSLGSL